MPSSPQPTPSAPAAVQVYRRTASDTEWSQNWYDLTDEMSLNRVNKSGKTTLYIPLPAPMGPASGQVSTITSGALTEISSSVHSFGWSDVLYVSNDENGSPQIYVIQVSTGNVIGTISLSNDLPNDGDPEGMAMDPDHRVWLGDIGDNQGTRTNKALYVFDETGPGTHSNVPTTRYPITYQGGGKPNAECLMIHPVTGDVYIVTKDKNGGQLFKLPDNPSTSHNTMINQNRKMPKLVVDGVFSSDGLWAFLKVQGDDDIWVYETETWTLDDKFDGPSLTKGESIALEPAGRSVLVGSEGSNSPLYREAVPETYWPEEAGTISISVPNHALQLRAKIAAESYDTGVASTCRRLVIWTLQNGQKTWVRRTEANWSVDGRWYCSAAESDWQYFQIPIKTATKFKVQVATENKEIVEDKNHNKYRRVSPRTSGSVWSDRYPTAIPSTATGRTVPDSSPFTVTWTQGDDDEKSAQSKYGVQVRRAAYGAAPAATSLMLDTGAVPSFSKMGNTNSYDIDVSGFPENIWYEWRVSLRDNDLWSPWSEWRTFFVVGTEMTPIPLSPISAVSVDTSFPVRFEWQFRDEDEEDQATASIRYRVASAGDVPGTTDDDLSWTTVSGDTVTPGSNEFWEFDVGTFESGRQYEWQVQTESSLTSQISSWSISGFFWTAPPTDVVAPSGPVIRTVNQGTLGCGTYRVFIYDRGGLIRRGEITPVRSVQWDRRRDDISQALVHTNGFGDDCAALLKTIHCWMHELVIFREVDGRLERVWEGPITRITEHDDHVEIDARDPMVYVYRRILRQGYNDAYPNLQTVTFRSTRIIQDALAYDDPNVLGYLTPIYRTGDAQESRVVASWSKTAWEEVDDMAANAGLDYTVVGRRIILWDVHEEIGRLPEMRNGDFTDPVVVTEYGMLTAGVFAVTNNAGVYGYAQAHGDDPGPYGFIEQIASSYGEADAAATDTLTPEALAKLQATLREQAERNIASRWPNPVVVRVPDNTTLMSSVGIGIDQLVPGVRIPLRSVGRLREVTQLQKLDRLTVTYSAEEQEKIKVVLSPAPSESVVSEQEAPPE